ncbi:MAG: acetylornithine transaminase [Bacillus sp. (in: firmicutes)]
MSHVFPTYARWDITPEQGEGTWLVATDGTKYLDFTSGIGVLNVGHRNEKVEKAIVNQLGKYYHTSNLFQQPLQEELATKLADITGLEAAFFCNSGAEANEAAIKLAKKATGRKKIVTCYQSFHGRTYATMGATGQEKVRIGYGPMLESFEYVTFNNEADVRNVVDQETAAIMIEIVQGEGGIHPATASFLQTVQEVAGSTGSLIIVDEVQTGVGRTGKPFAFQNFDFSPDIVTMAKGLGNGLPIGAMLGKKQLVEHFGPGSHGSTFGGNPISISAALAVVEEVFQADFLAKVNEKAAYLKAQLQQKLKENTMIQDIRGMGLMMAVELQEPALPVLKKLQTEGLLVLLAGPNDLRLLPPLTVSQEEMDVAVEKISKVLKAEVVSA